MVCNLAEHTNPDHNSIDIVKLLYVHARRTEALEHALRLTTSGRTGPLVWTHPEWPILPRLSGTLEDVVPGERSQGSQSQYIWHLASLSANIRVPHMSWTNITPFINSSLPDHRVPPDWSVLEPQLTSDPREFVKLLCEAPNDIPQGETEEIRRRWLHRLSTYYECPFDCGRAFPRSTDVRKHLMRCKFRTDESRALHAEKEAKKTLHCFHCDTSYTAQRYLDRHIRHNHQRLEPFTCPVPDCSVQEHFSNLGSWKRHFDYAHTWPRLQCPLCDSKVKNIHDHLVHVHKILSSEGRIVLVRKARSNVKKLNTIKKYKDKLDLKPLPPILVPKSRSSISRRSTSTPKGLRLHGAPKNDEGSKCAEPSQQSGVSTNPSPVKDENCEDMDGHS